MITFEQKIKLRNNTRQQPKSKFYQTDFLDNVLKKNTGVYWVCFTEYVRNRRGRSYKVYIFLITINSRDDIAMSVCLSVHLSEELETPNLV